MLQSNMIIVMRKERVIKQTKKVPHWKSPGSNNLQGYWLKPLTVWWDDLMCSLD